MRRGERGKERMGKGEREGEGKRGRVEEERRKKRQGREDSRGGGRGESFAKFYTKALLEI